MNLCRDENGNPFLKVGVHDDFADELFVAKLLTSTAGLVAFMQNPEAAHPEDLKVYTEQLAAHRKLLEWYDTPK